jgi:Xaa-Pro aminopeptidase
VRPFLEFETLTLAPYARALIEPALLTPAEMRWIDAYQARVLEEVGPHLDEATRALDGGGMRPAGSVMIEGAKAPRI